MIWFGPTPKVRCSTLYREGTTVDSCRCLDFVMSKTPTVTKVLSKDNEKTSSIAREANWSCHKINGRSCRLTRTQTDETGVFPRPLIGNLDLQKGLKIAAGDFFWLLAGEEELSLWQPVSLETYVHEYMHVTRWPAVSMHVFLMLLKLWKTHTLENVTATLRFNI